MGFPPLFAPSLPSTRIRCSLIGTLLGIIVVGFFILLYLSRTPAQAEWFIAGYGGWSIPGSIKNIDVFGADAPDGSTITDEPLQSSVTFGAKVGLFLPSYPWLGLELDAFQSNPNFKMTTVTLTRPGLPDATDTGGGQYFRVWTLAPSLLLRVPGDRWQPYVGVGPAVYWGRTYGTGLEVKRYSTAPGFHAKAGVQYLFFDRVALFGEWRHDLVRFNFDPIGPLFPSDHPHTGFRATYEANSVVVGLSYLFR